MSTTETDNLNQEPASSSAAENCAVRNSSSKKQRKSAEAEAEEKWQKTCREEARALYKQLLQGDFQPKLKFGDWFNAKYDEVLALYPDHKKKAQTLWKSLFKNNDFPTKTRPWKYTTADRFMQIAKKEFIRNSNNWPLIAELGWTTLYELSKLTPQQFELGKSMSLKWTRKSINDLRNPSRRTGKRKAEQGPPPNGPDAGRKPFEGGDEPRERFDLDLTGSSPLHISGEATANTLHWFRKGINKLVTIGTETRPDFKLAHNAERSDTTI